MIAFAAKLGEADDLFRAAFDRAQEKYSRG
jgi:hypothetical protein